jgi:ribosome biogenesis GTPase / thiamine phosphate phosphatase
MQYTDLAALGWNDFFAAQLHPEEAREFLPARIVAAHKTTFSLATERGIFTGTLAGKVRREAEDTHDLPVAGDWVLAKPPEGGLAVIVRRLERRTQLSRRRPLDRDSHRTVAKRQVLASNLDIVFIVSSLDQDLSPARLERTLALVWSSGATPVVLLSKADLCAEVAARMLEIGAVTTGVEVLAFSAAAEQGLQAIQDCFAPGITACLIGSSGVGKTTLINTLCGTERKTLAVRADDAKGRHATTERALFFLPEGGMLIDTPGLREIGLLEEHELSAAFSDLAALAQACQFADCSHRVEPGCAVLAALAAGLLNQERYQGYIKLRREMDYLESRDSVAKQQELKRRDKQLGKRIKEFYKRS